MVVTDLRRAALARYRQRVGFVFQRYHLLPALTVLDNVIAPVLPQRRGRADRAARARELLARWGWQIASEHCPPSPPAASSSGWRSPGR